GNYWQTVREKENISLNFSLPDSNLADQLELLRNKNQEKGIYGGNGWANYAASYFNDCYRFSIGIKYLLKKDGVALVVLGNSILQGIMIPTDRYFGEIAESVGLELVQIDVPRRTRVGNSIIQSNVRVGKTESRNQLYESVVELKKL
ncbi:MAG: site-specific DNA-methyltransferase, partial [Candidatus Thermoplasmatota archaeon]|nr:site-specific DNA-methyltransferase [Candidatus Thermoplasmatota archaeon]